MREMLGKLRPPTPGLRVSVVVPARNEEALIGACLRALAIQRGVEPEEYEILLVLDDCTDATAERALEVAAEYPAVRLYLLQGPGKGSGHARHVGMETAGARLLALDAPRGLIASTDADTVVASDWLSAQLAALDAGSQAIGGRIILADDESLPQQLADWHAERGRVRHRKLLEDPARAGKAEHWQFSGASLALTAEVYKEIGGLEPPASLEDEHLEKVLRTRGVPIDRLLSVRVTTSARLVGRATRGLSHDLAMAGSRFQVSGFGESPKPGA